MSDASIVGILGLVASIALAIVAWFLGGRRRTDADTTETIAKAAGEVVEQLRQELQRLILEVDILRRENAALKAETDELKALVIDLRRSLPS